MSVKSPNQTIAEAQKVVGTADHENCQVIFILHCNGRICIRDNSRKSITDPQAHIDLVSNLIDKTFD